jgi:hypothetical protein
MLRSSLSLCLKKSTARHGAAVTTLLTTRASSYASSDADMTSSSSTSTYFSSLSLANQSVPSPNTAQYSSSAAASSANVTIRTRQVPSGMGSSTTPSQRYRCLEEPTIHEDYDGLQVHHAVYQKTQESYYDFSFDPENRCGETGAILWSVRLVLILQVSALWVVKNIPHRSIFHLCMYAWTKRIWITRKHIFIFKSRFNKVINILKYDV